MKIYIFIFSLLLTQGLYSQESLSLPKAISIGLENNFGIKIAETNIQIAENNNTWARAGKTPTIDLNGTFSNNIIKDNNPASFLNGSYYSGSLGAAVDVQWILYSGGRVRITKERLEQSVSRQLLNKELQIHNLIKTISQQYYNVLFQQEQLIVLNTVSQLSMDRLSYEKTKKEFGSSNTFNLLQFENAVFTDSTNLLNQFQNVQTSKRTLYNTLKLDGYIDYEFVDRLSFTSEEINEQKLINALSDKNYTLKSLEIISKLNALNTKLAQSANKPTVGLSAGGGFTENGFQILADNNELRLGNRLNGNVNAFVNWNIYDGNVQDANIQNAKLQEQIDQLNILEAQAELNNQLDILISNYKNQKNMLDLADKQLNVSSKNLEISEERFKSGQITSLDYRSIQNQYVSAAFNKVNSIYNLVITKTEIDNLVVE